MASTGNLPAPADKAGGMRKSKPRQHHQEDKEATPQAGAVQALNPMPNTSDTQILIASPEHIPAGKGKTTTLTKANASTYAPPEPQHEKHVSKSGKQVSRRAHDVSNKGAQSKS
jgi:hypothetical protein